MCKRSYSKILPSFKAILYAQFSATSRMVTSFGNSVHCNYSSVIIRKLILEFNFFHDAFCRFSSKFNTLKLSGVALIIEID